MFRPKFRILWFFTAVVAIPVVYFVAASTLLRPVDNNIAFVEKELDGLKEYQFALSLYFQLYETQRPDTIIARVKAVPASNRFSAWKDAKNELASSQNQHSVSEVASVIREVILDIGDESNLILDPVLDSYYLVDTLFNQVPLFLIWGTSTTSYNMPMPEMLAHYSERLDHASTVVSVQAYSIPQLKSNIAALKADWQRIRNKDISAPSVEKILPHVQALSQTAMDSLNVLLHKRLAEQQRTRVTIIWIISGFYVAMSLLIVAAIRNYVSKREVSLAKERQQLITQLAQKNEELEKFVHAAAHDLKEPLRTMRCFAALLKSESAQELTTSTSEYVEVIENTASRAEQMINDLLGYTKLTEEKLVVETCDCEKEVAAVLEDLKSAIYTVKPDIKISTLPVIQTVPSMFRRVMLNLLDNALKYRRMDAPLHIAINAEQEDDCCLFSICDNGIGMAGDQVETVFEPFQRLEPALYQNGSGIGLTSCKKIVERLGGKIWINSAIDHGTTVYFSLPLRNS